MAGHVIFSKIVLDSFASGSDILELDCSLAIYSPDWEERLPVVPQIQVTLNCNLACEYCFQKHPGGVIEPATVEAILRAVMAHNQAVDPDNHCIQVYWHGGEPLLAGLGFFEEVVRLEARYPEFCFDNRIQTNGTLLTDELAGFLAERRFHVGFSLDGPAAIHDRHRRLRGSGLRSFDDVMKGIERYRRHAGVDRVAVIAVITRTGIDRARELFAFFKDLGADVQLDLYDLRCHELASTIEGDADLFALAPTPQEIGRFLIELFDLWFYDPDGLVDFKELRQDVKMILQPEIDRGSPFHKKRCDFRRLVFAPDGRVFSCDQWLNDKLTALGNIHTDPLTVILRRKAALWEEIKRQVRKSDRNMACGECEWGRRCGGGCLTCMKYNALLLRARREGLEDNRWTEATLSPQLEAIRGETYYCEGLKAFRCHAKEAVRRELGNVE